jgi:hypothetical protein
MSAHVMVSVGLALLDDRFALDDTILRLVLESTDRPFIMGDRLIRSGRFGGDLVAELRARLVQECSRLHLPVHGAVVA